MRYVGDMLAWVHQAVASERELLDSICVAPELANPSAAGSSSKELVQAADGEGAGTSAGGNTEAMLKMLHQIFEGVSRPLKVRVQQVLTGQSDLILAYKLTHLLAFYAQTLHSVLTPKTAGGAQDGAADADADAAGAKSSVVEAIEDCKESAAQSFDRLLIGQGERLLSAPAPYPSDLSPSSVTTDQTSKLVELLSVFDSSLLSASAGATQTVGGVIKVVVDPLLATVDRSASDHDLDKSNAAILQINNRLHVQKALLPFPAAQASADAIGAEIDSWLDVLVLEQVGVLLKRCGVLQVLQVLDKKASGVPCSTVGGLDQGSMTTVFKAFYATLFDLTIPHFDRLIQPAIRECNSVHISSVCHIIVWLTLANQQFCALVRHLSSPNRTRLPN